MSLMNAAGCCCSGVCCICNDPPPDTCINPSTPANCAASGGYFHANCDICFGIGNCCVYSTNNLNNHCCPDEEEVLESCTDGLTFCECMAKAVGGLSSTFHLNGLCVNNGCNEPSGECTPRRYQVFYQSTHEDYESQCAFSSNVCYYYHGPSTPLNIAVFEITTPADVIAKDAALAAWAAQSYTISGNGIVQTKTMSSESIGFIDTSHCGRYVNACDFPFTIEASEEFYDFEPGTCTENITAINTFPFNDSNFNTFYSTLTPPPDNNPTNCPPFVKYQNGDCTFTPTTCTTTGGISTKTGDSC